MPSTQQPCDYNSKYLHACIILYVHSTDTLKRYLYGIHIIIHVSRMANLFTKRNVILHVQVAWMSEVAGLSVTRICSVMAVQLVSGEQSQH